MSTSAPTTSDVLALTAIVFAALGAGIRALGAGSKLDEALFAAQDAIASERAQRKFPDLEEGR